MLKPKKKKNENLTSRKTKKKNKVVGRALWGRLSLKIHLPTFLAAGLKNARNVFMLLFFFFECCWGAAAALLLLGSLTTWVIFTRGAQTKTITWYPSGD